MMLQDKKNIRWIWRNTKYCHQQTSSVPGSTVFPTRLSKVTTLHLNNSRSSNSVVVADGSSVGTEDSVHLTVRASVANRNASVDLVVLDHSRREHRAIGKREGDVERAGGNLTAAGEVELNGVALLDGSGDALAHAQGGEGLDGESGVGGGACGDEGGGEGVDLVEVEGNIERLREGRLACNSSEEGIVAGLDGENATGGGDICLVGDEGGGAEVGAHTDALDDVCGGQEGLGSEVAKVVCALGDGCDASSLEGGGQEVDVGLLIAANLLEVLVEVGAVETSVGKVLSGELGEGLAVEVGLEMLKSQRIVENNSVED